MPTRRARSPEKEDSLNGLIVKRPGDVKKIEALRNKMPWQCLRGLPVRTTGVLESHGVLFKKKNIQ